MCIQNNKYSNGLKDCNFHKPEEDFLQKVRKFLAQLPKTIRQSNLFQKFAFSKSSNRHAECKFDRKAGRLPSKILKSFDQKREHSSITFPEKIPRTSFVLIENNFDEQAEGFSTKVLNQFTQILKKSIEKEIKIFETIFKTRWRQFRQTWWTVSVKKLKISWWTSELNETNFFFRKN